MSLFFNTHHHKRIIMNFSDFIFYFDRKCLCNKVNQKSSMLFLSSSSNTFVINLIYFRVKHTRQFTQLFTALQFTASNALQTTQSWD